MSGAFTQREMRRRDSRDVGFAPESDRLLHRREMTRRARSNQSALQQNGYYSITSSARTTSDAGTSRPSNFAVFELTTVWYFAGACTGSSAGFSPRKMRST